MRACSNAARVSSSFPSTADSCAPSPISAATSLGLRLTAKAKASAAADASPRSPSDAARPRAERKSRGAWGVGFEGGVEELCWLESCCRFYFRPALGGALWSVVVGALLVGELWPGVYVCCCCYCSYYHRPFYLHLYCCFNCW